MVALLCIASLLAPAGAAAQGSPFDPIQPSPTPQEPATVPEDQQSQQDDEGLTSAQQLLIVLSAAVLMGGIAWAIMRDARSAAPAQPRSAAGGGDGPQPRGSRKPAGTRHRESRARAKAARQARKKARKR